jgi:hypothetical protein
MSYTTTQSVIVSDHLLLSPKSPSKCTQSDTVILPDLLVGWARRPIKLNPYYNIVGPAAERWFKKYYPIIQHPSESEILLR